MDDATTDTSNYDRSPPYSAQAEISVLGAMLMDSVDENVRNAVAVLDDKEFFREANRRLFRSMLRILDRGIVLDVVTLGDDLQSTDELDRVGGMRYVADILEAVPTAANVAYHVRIVKEKASLRSLIDAASATVRDAYDLGERTPGDVLIAAQERLDRIDVPGGASTKFQWLHESVDDVPSPLTVAHGLAWEGMLSLFSGTEKDGKSTITRIAATAVSHGRKFLEGRHRGGNVLYVDIDDPLSKGHLLDLNPGPRVCFCSQPPTRSELIAQVMEVKPVLVVADSLDKFATIWEPSIDSGDASAWNRVLLPFRQIAHNHGAAVILIHHLKKDKSGYRDSGAIGAAVDQLVDLVVTGEHTRKISARGRVGSYQTNVRYQPPGDLPETLFPEGGDLPLETRILRAVEQYGVNGDGLTKNRCRDLVGGRKRDVMKTIDALLNQRVIRMAPGTRGSHLLLPVRDDNEELGL